MDITQITKKFCKVGARHGGETEKKCTVDPSQRGRRKGHRPGRLCCSHIVEKPQRGIMWVPAYLGARPLWQSSSLVASSPSRTFSSPLHSRTPSAPWLEWISRTVKKVCSAIRCRNRAIFTLTIMFFMDLMHFFLDTFLWYTIWNTVYSITHYFMLGLSIWVLRSVSRSKLGLMLTL